MKICKYCKKPIDDDVWNPDENGNGYHHSCLCQMEFESRDKRIYDKGKNDVLEKIRAEIQSNFENSTEPNNIDAMMRNIGREECLEIIDKYAEQEQEDVEDDIPYETGTIICDSCGSEIAFCPYCGTELKGGE